MATILIVEDMKVQAQLLAYHLDALGHVHRTAVNGKDALGVLAEGFRPDLIVSDVEMPEMNGLELCAAVKAAPDLRAIPLVLLTAADSPRDVLRGIDAMADGYLTKPYDTVLLNETVSSALARGAFVFSDDVTREPLEFTYGGEVHRITASREQMLKLFLSAYESSMVQNKLLIEKEQNLSDLNKRLSRSIDQLSASEERFRGLVQTIPDIVYKVDKEGRFTFVNDAIHRLGYHQSELIGHHFSSIVYDDDIDAISAASVLPQVRERNGAPVEPTPKLFDERRGADRMTIGLQVRLKTKAGKPGAPVEIQAIGDQLIYVEVNSLGMYGESKGAQRQYVGTVGVIRDISDRVQAQESMRMAKEAADAANQAKSEFLSSMSHELRTPLNAIIGFGQLLDDPANPLNEDQQLALAHILEGGEHLLGLINAVLDLAKIEAGSLAISIERIEPVKAAVQCTLMATALGEKMGIAVENNVAGDGVPWVMADLTRFKQVLINLLSNGVKYNAPKGKVTLDWSETDDGMVRFTVTDTGPGIPKAKQGLLFQPFQRLGKEASTIEGTGIGLSICRELMHRMNGRIGFASEEGKGSRFWADFPPSGRLDDGAVPPQVQDTEPARLADTGIAFDGEKTVLYIEDNPANLKLMERVLRALPSIRLLTASDAETGVELAKAERPDVILMDIHLPGMSGLEALGLLRETAETRDIPVVAVTAAAAAGSREAGLKAGFREYLTKPFDGRNIQRVVVRLLQGVAP